MVPFYFVDCFFLFSRMYEDFKQKFFSTMPWKFFIIIFRWSTTAIAEQGHSCDWSCSLEDYERATHTFNKFLHPNFTIRSIELVKGDRKPVSSYVVAYEPININIDNQLTPQNCRDAFIKILSARPNTLAVHRKS